MGDRYTEEQVDELFRDAPIKVPLRLENAGIIDKGY